MMQGRLINPNLVTDSYNCLSFIFYTKAHFLQVLLNNQRKIQFFVKLVKNFRIQNLQIQLPVSMQAEEYNF